MSRMSQMIDDVNKNVGAHMFFGSSKTIVTMYLRQVEENIKCAKKGMLRHGV